MNDGNDDFENLKKRCVKGFRSYFVDYWCPDINEHIAQVSREFAGKPELCAFHAELVIRIRRKNELEKNGPLFFDLWREHAAFLIDHLDSRWLISALDTFIDHGTERESLSAMAITSFMNAMMLAETEHRLCGSPTYRPEEVSRNKEVYPFVWDGRRVFHLPDDDTFANTVRRLRRVLEPEKTIAAIFETLLDRMFKDDTLLTRLAKHHERGLW